jgi:hypothetical protein
VSAERGRNRKQIVKRSALATVAAGSKPHSKSTYQMQLSPHFAAGEGRASGGCYRVDGRNPVTSLARKVYLPRSPRAEAWRGSRRRRRRPSPPRVAAASGTRRAWRRRSAGEEEAQEWSGAWRGGKVGSIWGGRSSRAEQGRNGMPGRRTPARRQPQYALCSLEKCRCPAAAFVVLCFSGRSAGSAGPFSALASAGFGMRRDDLWRSAPLRLRGPRVDCTWRGRRGAVSKTAYCTLCASPMSSCGR